MRGPPVSEDEEEVRGDAVAHWSATRGRGKAGAREAGWGSLPGGPVSGLALLLAAALRARIGGLRWQ